MKKIGFAVLALLALGACKQKGDTAREAAFIQQRDSLNRVIAQKDNEINDMMGTLNDIEEGFRAINEAEERVTVVRQEEGTTATELIREKTGMSKAAFKRAVGRLLKEREISIEDGIIRLNDR